MNSAAQVSGGGKKPAVAVRILSGAAAAGDPHIARGLAFADWFRTLLPADARLASGWRAKWAKCFRDMIALDGRTPEQIAAVCRWARANDFWRANFLTPLKLRKRDAQEAQYFDRFLAAMEKPATRAAAQKRDAAARTHSLPPGAGPLVIRR